jgi:hypothetical protein
VHSGVWWLDYDLVTLIGRTIAPDLISGDAIKLNCKLDSFDRSDQMCSRVPENFPSDRQWQGRWAIIFRLAALF